MTEIERLRNKGGTPFGDTTSAAFDEKLRRILEKVNPATVSKVVDENAEPLVVWHGSPESGFDVIDPGESRRAERVPSSFASKDLDTARSYSGTRDEADPTNLDEDGDFVRRPGKYPLFLNLKNPHEAWFEGANWDGRRDWQYQVIGEDGDPIYDENGRQYFDDRASAEALAELHEGSEVEAADDRWETTDQVVNEAKRYGADGAIIYDVIDSGTQGGFPDATDVYAAFDANQFKSATRNNGEFSASDSILFAPRPRGPFLATAPAKGKAPRLRQTPDSLPERDQRAIEAWAPGARAAAERERQRAEERARIWNEPDEANLPQWTTLEGVEILRIPGAKHGAIPATGRRNAVNYVAFDVNTREELAYLRKDEVRQWLINSHRNNEGQPLFAPRPRRDPNQLAFDFGTTGDLGDRNQRGFDFGLSASFEGIRTRPPWISPDPIPPMPSRIEASLTRPWGISSRRWRRSRASGG